MSLSCTLDSSREGQEVFTTVDSAKTMNVGHFSWNIGIAHDIANKRYGHFALDVLMHL
jgi:hypothetical protein